MGFNKGYRIEVDPEILGRDFDVFLSRASLQAEELLDKAPSDSNLKISIVRWNQSYQIAMNLNSKELYVCGEAEAKSPYVALEKALLRVRDKVNVWSVTKNLGQGSNYAGKSAGTG